MRRSTLTVTAAALLAAVVVPFTASAASAATEHSPQPAAYSTSVTAPVAHAAKSEPYLGPAGGPQ